MKQISASVAKLLNCGLCQNYLTVLSSNSGTQLTAGVPLVLISRKSTFTIKADTSEIRILAQLVKS